MTWSPWSGAFRKKFTVSRPKPTVFAPFIDAVSRRSKFLAIALLVVSYIPMGIALNLARSDEYSARFILPVVAAYAAVFTAMTADFAVAAAREKRFCGDLLERGGKTVSPWNAEILGGEHQKHMMSLLRWTVMLLACCAATYYASERGVFQKPFAVSFSFEFLLRILFVLPINFYFCASLLRGGKEHPVVFMGADEGLYFGGILLPYEALRETYPSANEKDTHIAVHDKLTVVAFRLLPEDMEHLRAMMRERLGEPWYEKKTEKKPVKTVEKKSGKKAGRKRK